MIMPTKVSISYADAVKKTSVKTSVETSIDISNTKHNWRTLLTMSDSSIKNAFHIMHIRRITRKCRYPDEKYAIKEALILRRSYIYNGLVPINENSPIDWFIKIVKSDDYDPSLINHFRYIDEMKDHENKEKEIENILIEERKKRKKQNDIIIKELLTIDKLLQKKIATIPNTKEWVITKKLLSEKLSEVKEAQQEYINTFEFLTDYMIEKNLSYKDVFAF